MATMTMKRAQEIIGSQLGRTSKMPARSWGISTTACITGRKLREQEGTSCHECYAAQVRSRYGAPSVQGAHKRRLAALSHPEWIEAMVHLIGKQSPEVMRWFDSGDLQSVQHLEDICEIARRLPNTKFWLPTQERGIIRQWRKKYGVFPPNLCIRVSAIMLGQHTGAYANDAELCSSMVVQPDQSIPDGVVECPSYKQGHKCLDCRNCWSREVKCVAYRLHS